MGNYDIQVGPNMIIDGWLRHDLTNSGEGGLGIGVKPPEQITTASMTEDFVF